MDVLVLALTWVKTFRHWREARSLNVPVMVTSCLIRDGTPAPYRTATRRNLTLRDARDAVLCVRNFKDLARAYMRLMHLAQCPPHRQRHPNRHLPRRTPSAPLPRSSLTHAPVELGHHQRPHRIPRTPSLPPSVPLLLTTALTCYACASRRSW